ncbi:hypothetical protein F5J12DRAFT_898844 [Pisolithus orientalis]|uniref:uncharacterized protein n=1 Tax=Pisolithus orientalis TaxID=936130 RepID=UPI002225888A|nr:uncharacterized protein F5J12DRAFT_898844 [Pisolithus orientalis]KAI5986041.1 hypothetical protein F5J12DRAFT_898844 [Pisolithus orientalis]
MSSHLPIPSHQDLNLNLPTRQHVPTLTRREKQDVIRQRYRHWKTSHPSKRAAPDLLIRSLAGAALRVAVIDDGEVSTVRIDVAVVDRHSRLIGLPLKTNFYDELIFAAKASNVFAVLGAADGSLAWRSIHGGDDPIMTFDMYDDSNVAMLSGLDTRSTTHSDHSRACFGRGGTGLFALANGETVRRFGHPSDDVARAWSSILTTPDAICAISPAMPKAAYHLPATSLFIGNGSTIAFVNITVNLGKHVLDFILLMPDIGLAEAGQDGSAHALRYNGESLRPLRDLTDGYLPRQPPLAALAEQRRFGFSLRDDWRAAFITTTYDIYATSNHW